MKTYECHADIIDAALTREQVEQYKRDGFLIVREVFTATEIAELDQEAKRLMQRTDLMDSDNIRCRWSNHYETNECLKHVAGYPNVRLYEGAWKEYVWLENMSLPAETTVSAKMR